MQQRPFEVDYRWMLDRSKAVFGLGGEDVILSMPTIATPDMYRYYWHQKF